MARRNRKYAEGTQWIRLLPRGDQSAGEHALIFQDERRRQHAIPVHTSRWTPYPADMIARILNDAAIAAKLEFSKTQPQESE